MRKHCAGRGEPRVELLASRRRVADELLVVEGSGANKRVGVVDRVLDGGLSEHGGGDEDEQPGSCHVRPANKHGQIS
jgi:hypothetical protein